MNNKYKFIDLFCGIGGFRYAIENAAARNGNEAECVFSSDIDKHCQDIYEDNFGERPVGDISLVSAKDIPEHNILLAGFPCQPFSIIGQMKGFDDTRGTLFFEIARILAEKKPDAFVLENVKLLAGHDRGRTIQTIVKTLEEMKYTAQYKIFNALDFGLPQKRERIFIVGFKNKLSFSWPAADKKMTPLDEILEKNVYKKYYVSEKIRKKILTKKIETTQTAIWHENKAGNISAYPYSCALRANASYNYLLVDGKRRLTGREMLRLQGFDDSFKITCSYMQIRKQAGNSLPIPVATAVIDNLMKALDAYKKSPNQVYLSIDDGQYVFLEKGRRYNAATAEVKNRRKIQTALSFK
ncbi:MAG: DNA (cytosine-5-)-methyltransferase [Endomicrobium sp.]|jgi:DNA (cytosine-5)-methyltransferase 1|nr:DNA (cytosine-5-)-methyltransferase [Endomicrobium sp.]